MERPRITLDSTKKTKLKFLTFALFTLFASSCGSKSPQDIVSGIRTDGDNRRSSQALGQEYQDLEKKSTNGRDIYDLRLLQDEQNKRSSALMDSRHRQMRELGAAERKLDRQARRNSRSNRNEKDPLNGKDIEWDPTDGAAVDELLGRLYGGE